MEDCNAIILILILGLTVALEQFIFWTSAYYIPCVSVVELLHSWCLCCNFERQGVVHGVVSPLLPGGTTLLWYFVPTQATVASSAMMGWIAVAVLGFFNCTGADESCESFWPVRYILMVVKLLSMFATMYGSDLGNRKFFAVGGMLLAIWVAAVGLFCSCYTNARTQQTVHEKQPILVHNPVRTLQPVLSTPKPQPVLVEVPRSPSSSIEDVPGLYAAVEIADDHELDLKRLVLHKKLLGKGNFGKVYLGTIGPREVAVKVIPPPMSSIAGEEKGKAAREFAKEISTWQKLPYHENVAKLLGVVDNGSDKCIVMPFYRGGSLKEELDNNRRRGSIMTKVKSLSILLAVSQGLKHLHSHKLVHRDLAARNILFQDKNLERVVIADFGLSREIGGKEYYAMMEGGLMAVAWLPPETLIHNRSSMKSDVWSFGVVVWEIITQGLDPLSGLTVNQIIAQAVRGALSNSFFQALHNADRDLVALAKTCLIPDPKTRPSITDVAKMIDAMLRASKANK